MQSIGWRMDNKGGETVKTLIIYDAKGYVINNITGAYRVPSGVPFLEVTIPEGKRIKYTDGIGVNVSVTPHEVILEDIPPSEIEVLKSENEALKASQASQDELIMSLMLGGV